MKGVETRESWLSANKNEVRAGATVIAPFTVEGGGEHEGDREKKKGSGFSTLLGLLQITESENAQTMYEMA